MTWEDLRGRELLVSDSPAESEAFGLAVSKVSIPLNFEGTAEDVLEATTTAGADLVILRSPAARVELSPWLTLQLPSYDIFHVDTLVYWILQPQLDRVMDATSVVTRPNALSAAEAVEAIFSGYLNHYAANPRLAHVVVAEAYRDWTHRHIVIGEPALALLVDDQIAGVATYSLQDDHAEILLAGIVERFQGQGLYSNLLSAVEQDASEAGVGSLIISTQVHNRNVQRAWARYGFVPLSAFQTYHIMPRTSQSIGYSPAR